MVKKENTFLSKKAPHIGLGWNKLGDVTHLRSRKEFEDRYIQVHGRDKSLSQTVGQNYRFVVEVSIGDYVVYSKDRVIHIGVVTSEAQHHPNKVYSTIREVKWLSHAPASMLPVSAYNEVNSALSFFSLKNNPLAF